MTNEFKLSSRMIDETGNIYGKLTVIEPVGLTKKKSVIWKCACSCGNTAEVKAYHLRGGNTRSCGCLVWETNSSHLEGERFGRLLAIKDVGRTKRNLVRWLCKCDCGKETIVTAGHLRSGEIRSCGCYNRDVAKERATIHGNTSNGSYYNYPPEWTYEFREGVRERDNHECQMCGRTELEENQFLAVHHIDYNRDNTVPENCITLCHSCHSKTNHNRKNWIEFFKVMTEKKHA